MRMKALPLEKKFEDLEWIKHFKNKNSFIFFDYNYSEVPDVSSLIDNKRASENIFKLEDYLLRTFPIYMGTNSHEEMIEIEKSFSKEEYEWHKRHNKLGINSWGAIAGTVLGVLEMNLNRTDLAIRPFPESENYHAMSFFQKVKLVSSVYKKVYEVLEKLYLENMISKSY